MILLDTKEQKKRQQQMAKIRKGLLLMIVLSIPVAFCAGWLVGSGDGVEYGENHTLKTIDKTMQHAVAEGTPFYIRGGQVRFIPRQDGHLNAYVLSTAQPIDIAGVHDEGPRKVWQR